MEVVGEDSGKSSGFRVVEVYRNLSSGLLFNISTS